MPLYKYRCDSCGEQRFKILTPEQAKTPPTCKCGLQMERNPTGPSSSAKELLDNGIMSRKIERLNNAEELYKERAEKHSKDYGPKE